VSRLRPAFVLALAVGALALGALAPTTATAQDVTQYVDPMTGTIPVGFVFPGAATPFGMVQNSPDTTSPIAYTGYVYTDPDHSLLQPPAPLGGRRAHVR